MPPPRAFALKGNVVLEASDGLTITIAGSTTLRLPLLVDRVDEIVEAAANAITSGVALDRAPRRDPATEALDLLLQARFIGQRDVVHIGEAIERLERARALLPEDPQIAANLAIPAGAKRVLRADVSGDLLARSKELVRVALDAGPQLRSRTWRWGSSSSISVGRATPPPTFARDRVLASSRRLARVARPDPPGSRLVDPRVCRPR
jgi:hypothetical protein